MRGNRILERLTVQDCNTPHSCDYRYKSPNEKVSSLDKRLKKVEENRNRQIWALIGILFTAVVATAIRFVFVSLPNFQ